MTQRRKRLQTVENETAGEIDEWPTLDPVDDPLAVIEEEFRGRFIGRSAEPNTLQCLDLNCEDDIIYSGDRLQIRTDIDGYGGTVLQRFCMEHTRDELHPDELTKESINALVTFETVGKATIPIAEGGWPEDYDLEGRKVLNPWRFEPCNNALHLDEVVRIDDVSLPDEGHEVPTHSLEPV